MRYLIGLMVLITFTSCLELALLNELNKDKEEEFSKYEMCLLAYLICTEGDIGDIRKDRSCTMPAGFVYQTCLGYDSF